MRQEKAAGVRYHSEMRLATSLGRRIDAILTTCSEFLAQTAKSPEFLLGFIIFRGLALYDLFKLVALDPHVGQIGLRQVQKLLFCLRRGLELATALQKTVHKHLADGVLGNALDICPHDAEIGQFTVRQGLQLRHGPAVTLPGGNTGFQNFKHFLIPFLGINDSSLTHTN